VPGGAVLGGPDLLGARPHRDTLHVAVAVADDALGVVGLGRTVRHERVVRQRLAGVPVDPQYLAAEAVLVLCGVEVVPVTGADQQLAVRAHGRPAADVRTGRAERQPGDQVLDLRRRLLVLAQPPGDQPDVLWLAVGRLRGR